MDSIFILGSFPEIAIFSKTNDNFYSTIVKISGMGMPLATITNNGNCFLLYDFDVRVFVIKNLRQNSSPYILCAILVDRFISTTDSDSSRPDDFLYSQRGQQI